MPVIVLLDAGGAARRCGRGAAVPEQHALCPAGRFEREVAGAVRAAGRYLFQQGEVLRIHRAAGGHHGRDHLDVETILLRPGARERVAVGLAIRGAIDIEDDGVACRIRHGRRLLGRLVRHAHPLPDDARDRVTGCGGRRSGRGGSRGNGWRDGHACGSRQQHQSQRAGCHNCQVETLLHEILELLSLLYW